MLNYVTVFFVLTSAAGLFVFGAPGDMFVQLAQLIAVILMALFLVSIIHYMIGARKRSPHLD